MKKYFVCILVCVSAAAFASETNVTISNSYPIPLGNNFMSTPLAGEKYKGIDAVGIGVNHSVCNNFFLGIEFNLKVAAYLKKTPKTLKKRVLGDGEIHPKGVN